MKTTNLKINWNEYRDNAVYVNVIDLTDDVIEKIIEENEEYLAWKDGSGISKDELQADFMLLKMEDGMYSLTMKDENFYIHDIIFSE
jgi:glutamine cyclotransferase